MSSYPIASIEGIGPVMTEKLKKIGIRTTAALLARARHAKGRKQLAAASGIDEQHILRWTNIADLMRVRGVGEEYSELLEAAGVDTVKELKHRNPANLAKALASANGKRQLVRLLPSEKRVVRWIDHAKTLPPMMTY